MNDDFFEPREYKVREYIGRLYIHGPNVKDGSFGLKQLTETFFGLSKVISHFEPKSSRIIKNIDFPVTFNKGSIEVAIGFAAGYGSAYLTELPKVIAKDGILGSGLVKDFKKLKELLSKKDQNMEVALSRAISVMKIAKFCGGIGKSVLTANNILVKADDTVVKLCKNGESDCIYTNPESFDDFCRVPISLYKSLVRIVSENVMIDLEVITESEGKKSETVNASERKVFALDEDSDMILPELVDGKEVSLYGSITRVNKRTNSLGFLYDEHVITCLPCSRNISEFKDILIADEDGELFITEAMITGVVERKDIQGEVKKKKPRIIFSAIEHAEIDDSYLSN